MVVEGIVLRATNGTYTVDTEDCCIPCSLRGNLKKNLVFSTGPTPHVTRARRLHARGTVSIGDRVRIETADGDQGVIEEVLPRHSRFARAGFRGQEHTIVSNLDQLVIVFACQEPRLDPWRLDRFLVAAEMGGLAPIIVANKLDLQPDGTTPEGFAEYEALGYRVLPTSATHNAGMSDLRDALAGRLSAFVGPSGVGKSSLLNALAPDLNLRTSDIGHVTYKGRHTTTAAEIHRLECGGWMADTPGLRQLDLLQPDPNEILEYFPEFRNVEEPCHFADCSHTHEPGCAVRARVAEGLATERRYESYVALRKEAIAGNGRGAYANQK